MSDAPETAESKAFAARKERAAQALWHRFAPSHHIEWDDETHKAEYRLAVDDIVEILDNG